MSGFAHRIALDQVRDGARIELVAGEAERGELAGRLGLLALDRLDAHVVLSRDGQRVRASTLLFDQAVSRFLSTLPTNPQ